MDATKTGHENGHKSDTNIAALAALFPAAFCAEPWQAHRPLKVGIGKDLVARGVLGPREINAALKRYVDRLMYQKCLVTGGARIDLEGNVAGEVSNEHRSRAERLVARIEARQLAETAAAEAQAEGGRGVGHAAMPPSVPKAKAIAMPLTAQRHRPPVPVASGLLTSSAQRRSGGRVRRPNVTMEQRIKQPNEYVGADAGSRARCALTGRAACASPVGLEFKLFGTRPLYR
jgi:sRNA-binding protein